MEGKGLYYAIVGCYEYYDNDLISWSFYEIITACYKTYPYRKLKIVEEGQDGNVDEEDEEDGVKWGLLVKKVGWKFRWWGQVGMKIIFQGGGYK